MKFKQKVILTPAYDKRHTDPHKNYGIHNAELRMILIGDKGAVQFVMSTGWYLPHVEAELDANHKHRSKAWGTDLGYHSYTPMYEEQSRCRDACEYLDGKPCYYDGSTLNAEPVFNLLVSEGFEAVWKRLKIYYKDTFNNERPL